MDITRGQVVISKAGRDKGKCFLVYDYAEPYVYLVDGKLRRLECPKKKKEKHIQVTNHIDRDIEERIINESRLNNADIRKSLSQFMNKSNQEQ